MLQFPMLWGLASIHVFGFFLMLLSSGCNHVALVWKHCIDSGAVCYGLPRYDIEDFHPLRSLPEAVIPTKSFKPIKKIKL